MNEEIEVPTQDWREKPLTAGELHDIFSRMASSVNEMERISAYVKKAAQAKCRPLTPSEIDEKNGFRHSCGGGVIGCRCRENWLQSQEEPVVPDWLREAQFRTETWSKE